MKCKYNKGSFWFDKYCFRNNNCNNCPIKQETELGNPILSNVKRTKPLLWKELFFRDKFSIINKSFSILLIIVLILTI